MQDIQVLHEFSYDHRLPLLCFDGTSKTITLGEVIATATPVRSNPGLR